jgi:hypothetical protein
MNYCTDCHHSFLERYNDLKCKKYCYVSNCQVLGKNIDPLICFVVRDYCLEDNLHCPHWKKRKWYSDVINFFRKFDTKFVSCKHNNSK